MKICKDGRKWGQNNSYVKSDYKKKLSKAKQGKNNPFWKDGRSKRKYKYKQIQDNGKLIYVHRKIMEEHLERKLKKGEIVHHINGNTYDNRIENLELWEGRKEHAKFHGNHRQLGVSK